MPFTCYYKQYNVIIANILNAYLDTYILELIYTKLWSKFYNFTGITIRVIEALYGLNASGTACS